ncbi:4'-phosphopantetheinyl transferase superfamily protein [Streptomyces sp. ZAF1911]|uniref:4'-phosphopantetheinyl transferase family protein n=1 Tax=Streptomyces sp. ZAF1911 TaxID=2944129 RepID=UPI00237A2F9B|nr:4'-phosphopantetheinyl transferase superfamily protein [Streptomyces sp. ZAF1911]MDD9382940.1 4'-phosphopantetheinyl transferase superfamily protein [Streptomyces sp. ZAF1911]
MTRSGSDGAAATLTAPAGRISATGQAAAAGRIAPAGQVAVGPGVVRAWWADGRGLPAGAVAELAAAALAPQERSRYDAVSDPLGRAEFVLARYVLRSVLGRMLGRPPARVGLAVDRAGRPWVTDAPGVDVSIAHAAGLVAVAVGSGLAPRTRIGVDVEEVRTVARAGDLARRLFSPAERARLGRASGRAGDLLWLDVWTRREAYVKAVGTGVRSLAGAPEQDVGHLWQPLRLPRGFTGGLVVVEPG